jgi:ribosomal protein S18 acetylase RimI-like enzyme
MPVNLTVTLASSPQELQQILDLQAQNLRHLHSAEEEAREGFVTVCHTPELLAAMNEAEPHVIIKDGDRVVAYALCMSTIFRYSVPELKSMFELLDNLPVMTGKKIPENYLVMGQICVDKNYRGKGLFRQLYTYYFETYLPKYQCILTEVAVRNTRSQHAHMSLGFREIWRYTEPGVEEWVVLVKYAP